MFAHRFIPLLTVSLALATACKGKEPSGGSSAPRHKTKDEALQVFEKHRETYVRCEKLRLARVPTSTETAGKSPPPINVLDQQGCFADYWKKMKADMGPYDQAKVDEWYAEWKQGVKIE